MDFLRAEAESLLDDLPPRANADRYEVIHIKSSRAGHAPTILEDKVLNSVELQAFLEPPPAASDGISTKLVRIQYRSDLGIKSTAPMLREIWRSFRLDPYMIYMFHRNVPGYFQLPSTSSNETLLNFYINSQAYWMLWSYESATLSTNALLISRISPGGRATYPFVHARIQRYSNLAGHPLFLAVATAIERTTYIDKFLREQHRRIGRTEQHTGFSHFYIDTPQHHTENAEETLARLSDQSRSASSVLVGLADMMQHLQLSTSVVDAFLSYSLTGNMQGIDSIVRQDAAIKSIGSVLRPQVKERFGYVNYVKDRAQNQLTVLFNLLARGDAQANIDLAKAAMHDSTSMKTIAIMTMGFLPATFVAALFAVPSLQWDQPTVIGSRFWVYWAITIPTTILVFIIWFSLMHSSKLLTIVKETSKRNMGKKGRREKRKLMMPSIHHYLGDTQNVWEQFNCSICKDFSVSEIWEGTERDATTTLHRKVSNEDLLGWLDRTDGENHEIEANVKRKCVFRIVWVLRDTKRCVNDIDSCLLEKLRAAFSHQLAQKYLQTQYAGIGSTTNKTTGEEAYFLCNHPKLAVSWSQKAEAGTISVICIADRLKLNILQDLVERRFIQELSHSKLTPALICAILSSKEIDIEAGEVKKLIREVEVRTGYHQWAGRSEGPARGDLVSLSARMGGCGSRIESNTRKLGVVLEFGHFIHARLEEEQSVKNKDELLSINHIIERRTAMQTIDLKYIQFRIQTQKNALFNLIAANDSATAQKIAEESHRIALATKSDAQSMKLLALIATLFLPGTFVSGLFSTPLFERESNSTSKNSDIKIWKPGLFLYIAISCSLLLLTFLTWGLWLLRQRLRHEADRKMATEHLHQSVGTTETENLARKRDSLSR
ncbi:MAG: hypothetical protein M1822_004911 [Bathelium mastoideum]|nr:MAG: hypothetical protein M1822_004911 [Bathelium mastoideum]